MVNSEAKASSVKEYLRNEIAESESCLQLPWAIGLFLMFLLSFRYHQCPEILHSIDNSMRFDIMENANFAFTGSIPFENGRMGHKSLPDVNSIADFWSWFNLGLVPLFFPEGWDISEARTNIQVQCAGESQQLKDFGFNQTRVEEAFRGQSSSPSVSICPEQGTDKPRDFFGDQPNSPTYLFYNSIVGGVKLSQETTEAGPCELPINPLWWQDDTTFSDLWKAIHEGLYTGSCVNDGDVWLRPEKHSALGEHTENKARGAYKTQYLLSNLRQTEIRRQLLQLEDEVWLSPETSKVEVLFTTFNPHKEVFTATFCMFFLTRGGHIFKMIVPVSVWLSPYHGWWNYVLDGLWMLLVLKLFLEELIEIAVNMKRFGCCRGIKKYANLANCIDLLSVAYSGIIVYIWYLHIMDLMQLKEYLAQANPHIPGSWVDADLRAEYFDHVGKVVRTTYTIRYVLAGYPFVIVSRFLKGCYAQPRLALAMKTFERAAVDIFHFSIFFIGLCSVYALAAMILFGQELDEFANIPRCFTSVICILYGDFDWSELNEVGRIPAGIWMGTFIGGVNLVILNMLLAIIMDMYTEVKGSIGPGAETLPSQAMEIWQRWRGERRGDLVSLSVILASLDPQGFTRISEDDELIGDGELLTPRSLMDLVEGMTHEQAMHLIRVAQDLEQSMERGSQSMTDGLGTIAEIRGKVDLLLDFTANQVSRHRQNMPDLNDVML